MKDLIRDRDLKDESESALSTAKMVCISCILIPLALFVWHRFLQPMVAHLFPSLASKVDKKLEQQNNSGGDKARCPIGQKEQVQQEGGEGQEQEAKKVQ